MDRTPSCEELERIEQEAGIQSAPPETPPGADWNTVEEAFLRRRSIRKYKGRQVPPHLIRRILEIGRYAPTQGNSQPWKFVVLRDKELLERIENSCVAECQRLTAAIDYTNYPPGSWRRATTRLKAQLLNRLDHNMLHPVPVGVVKIIAEGRFTVFHRAPTVILLLMDKRGVGCPEIDIGIVGTNIIMAAHSLGLGTCWVGFAKFLNGDKQLARQLGAEWPFEIIEGICIGYAIGEPMQNHISRQTHEIAWWEDGKKEIFY